MTARGLARALTWTTSAAALALTAHTVWNLRNLRRPPPNPPPPAEWVSVLLPVRDEAHRVEPALRALLAALDACREHAELVVLDDGSTDGTLELVRAVAGDDPRVRVVDGRAHPGGLAGQAVGLPAARRPGEPREHRAGLRRRRRRARPDAVAATVHQLRDSGLDLVSPYPRQLAVTAAERLVQPLLQWSWLTTLPLARRRALRRGRRMSAANGQLLAGRPGRLRPGRRPRARRAPTCSTTSRCCGRSRRAGGRGGVTDGTALATCRMYDGWPELRDGYGKSLWTAFGSPAGGVAVSGVLGAVYCWPALAALAGSPVGALGYAAGVAGRVATGRRTGARVWPDALAHPVSVAAVRRADRCARCASTAAARCAGRAGRSRERPVASRPWRGSWWWAQAWAASPSPRGWRVAAARRHRRRAAPTPWAASSAGSPATASPSTPGPSLLTLPAGLPGPVPEDRRRAGALRRAGRGRPGLPLPVPRRHRARPAQRLARTRRPAPWTTRWAPAPARSGPR